MGTGVGAEVLQVASSNVFLGASAALVPPAKPHLRAKCDLVYIVIISRGQLRLLASQSPLRFCPAVWTGFC